MLDGSATQASSLIAQAVNFGADARLTNGTFDVTSTSGDIINASGLSSIDVDELSLTSANDIVFNNSELSLVADTLTMTAAGALAFTEGSTITVTDFNAEVGGDITLQEITADMLHAVSSDGSLVLNQDVTVNNDVLMSAQDVLVASDVVLAGGMDDTNAFNTFVVTATAGDILLGAGAQIHTDQLIASTTDAFDMQTDALINAARIDIDAGDNVTLQTLAGDTVIIHSTNGNVQQQGNINVTGDVDFMANAITMSGSATTVADNIFYQATNGDIRISSLTANAETGVINLTTSGSLIDLGVNDNGAAIANRLEIESVSGISGLGTDGAVDFISSADTLSVKNETDMIHLTNVNKDVTLEALWNVGDVFFTNTTGDIMLGNENSSVYVRGNERSGIVNSGYNDGFLSLTATTGSILPEVGSRADENAPDVAAREIEFVAADTIGQVGRKLILYVRDGGTYDAETIIKSGNGFDIAPATRIVTIRGRLLDEASLFRQASQLVIELESIDEVDAAVFTEVRNYSYDNISVKLPRDQLYEEEDDLGAYEDGYKNYNKTYDNGEYKEYDDADHDTPVIESVTSLTTETPTLVSQR